MPCNSNSVGHPELHWRNCARNAIVLIVAADGTACQGPSDQGPVGPVRPVHLCALACSTGARGARPVLWRTVLRIRTKAATAVTDTPLPPSEPNDLEPTDLIPDPVIGIDAYRRINLWNRAAERTYGFTRAEAIGQRPPELLLTRFPIPLLEVLETVEDAGHWRGDVSGTGKRSKISRNSLRYSE